MKQHLDTSTIGPDICWTKNSFLSTDFRFDARVSRDKKRKNNYNFSSLRKIDNRNIFNSLIKFLQRDWEYRSEFLLNEIIFLNNISDTFKKIFRVI